METKRLRSFLLIIGLIAVSGAAMAYTSGKGKALVSTFFSNPTSHFTNGQIVNVTGHLVQKKVLQDSAGTIGLSLTLQTDEIEKLDREGVRHVDMVIVLDRSGSMKGRKIEDARQAVLTLIQNLSPQDRFALITYSDRVRKHTGLLNVTQTNRHRLISAIEGVRAGGSTNLGAGLQAGINLLLSTEPTGNAKRVILISDGLANKGITDPRALGNIASLAVEKEFGVSTAGVGFDFNEHLMTSIADKGTGNYYYLENPQAFAEVFQKELYLSSTAVATSLSVHVPVQNGVMLIDASGYPVELQNGHAVFYPGDMRSGQNRHLFLRLKVPTRKKAQFEIGQIKVRYQYNEHQFETETDKSFQIACVKSKQAVFSSISKTKWEDKVLKEDYNRLKQEVSADVKAGRKKRALKRIQKYYEEQESVNAVVGSGKVAQNLDKDLNRLRSVVKDTFKGAPAAVYQKQKANAKSLQYEGYKGRRQK